MRILVTGANGLLGGFLVPELVKAGHEVLATGLGPCRLSDVAGGAYRYATLDITDAMMVFESVDSFSPDAIVHAAAVTQADDCEKDPVRCWTVNVTASRFIVDAAKMKRAFMIFISTDFVFDGAMGPYREEDATGPVNYYGCSKLAAEKSVLSASSDSAVVRTVLVYGPSPNMARSSLMGWVARNLREGRTIRVVSDQIRTPTFAGDLARGIRKVVEQKASGLWHLSGRDVLTPYEMAVRTADMLGLDKSLMERVDAATFSQPARRPLRTGFIIEKARRELGYDPVSFEEGLRRTIPFI
jgi:dTDP-4-dehydrorhamnose reductase